MRWILACLLMCALITPALAYERPQAVSLNGGWELAAAEPMIELAENRVDRPDFPQLSPAWDEVIDPRALPPWDSDWQPVAVPAAWEQYLGTGYNGAGWYARYVDIPPEWCGADRRIWLEFDAVATAAGVWVENEFIGAHVGDYSRWRVELTDVMRRRLAAPRAGAPEPTNIGAATFLSPDSGDDELASRSGATEGAATESAVINPYTLLIAVYVDELPGHITQGFLNMVAPHHGGIWQDVRVYSTGLLAIEPDGVRVAADYQARAVEVAVDLEGDWLPHYLPVLNISWHPPDDLPGDVYLSAQDAQYTYEYDPQMRQLRLAGTLDEQWLRRWSVAAPHVYKAWLEFTDVRDFGADRQLDEVVQSFAFRTVEIDGSQLLLNDEPIYIRSALNWGYYPGVISPNPGPEVIREEFAYIKSLGFNAETVCLINLPDYFYDIADEMGVLLWQEYPTWHNDFSAEHSDTYQRELPAFIKRDRNHPSVIMRSLSVEAGVADQDMMTELYATAKGMTNEPVQDNNSWFSHSNPETTDWYGEDYYLNCNQWAKHMLVTLPARLDEYPEKPYIIGETMCFNCWPDIDGLVRFGDAVDDPTLAAAEPCRYASAAYWRGLGLEPDPALASQFGGPSPYPYWYPICFDRCCEIEWELAERYNNELPDGEDIIFDYLLPQSKRYSLNSRRFQMQLLHADPRYRGYTINVVRDIPQLRGGLIDDLGNPRYTPEEWSWHGDGTDSPVLVGRTSVPVESTTRDGRPTENSADWSELTKPLLAWDDGRGIEPDTSTPVYLVDEGYADLRELFADWPDLIVISAQQVPELTRLGADNPRPVVVTSVLTHDLVDYMGGGGVVVLITSKWPGALGSHHHYFWRDSCFAPPVGPFDRADVDKLVELHPFDLTLNKAEVIPVDELGITGQVDPLIRLYDTHDLSTVITYDALFATRVGAGLLIASSLDHGTTGGQWVLGKLCGWAAAWFELSGLDTSMFGIANSLDTGEDPAAWARGLRAFPVTSLSVEQARQLATARANQIIPLNEDWRFLTDPEQTGEERGLYQPDVLIECMDTIQCGKSWESQGYSYDGMAWYRKWVEIPADWTGSRVKLVAEGIDDAYTVWVDGEAVATHGSFTDHEQTVWQMQTTTDITDYITPGASNLIVLQVVDIVGQGGVYKPLYLAVE
ncbi:hypothetical protein JW859_01525 [bacterium]|nr:hypothetical protein [bacterium]